ncbi:MAG: FAD-binding oxidoreductase [Ottowia sp.]|nr:FAD-binding oxidoreductase [Ottowia sp.]
MSAGFGIAQQRRRIVRDAEFIVRARSWLSPAIVQLELAPLHARIAFRPGQYVQVCDPAYRLPPRSYSVANAPRADGLLQLLVTAVPEGPVSGWLTGALGIGDRVLVSGPYGTFTLPPQIERPVLALAGGSGWAPLRAMAEQAEQAGFPHPFHVLFSARAEDDVLDAAQMRQWQQAHRPFRYQRTLTRASGQPPLGRIPQVLPTLYADLSGMDVYIAGPPGLVAACTQAARSLGARPGHVHTEAFYSDPEPW